MNPARAGEHPRAEEVDAILDGTGGAPEVAAHVDACPRCRHTRDGLVEVRALLREESQRVPQPPSDLGARIAAALGEEPPYAVRRGFDPDDDAARTPGSTVVALSSRRRIPAGWLAAAAAVAVLAGGAAVAAQVMSVGGTDIASTAQDAGAQQEALPEAAQGSDPGSDPGSDQGDGSALEGAQQNGGKQGALALTQGDVGTLASGTDYTPAGLDDQVGRLLDAAGSAADRSASLPAPAAAGPSDATDPGDAGAPQALVGPDGDLSLADPALLEGCLQGLGATGAVSVAVDLARWQGTDAAVLVLRPAGAPAEGDLQVWVVDRTCGPGAPGLVHFSQLTR